MSNELSRLQAPVGANRAAKHKGRGMGSGNGKTAGRGMKGQKARKSGNVRIGFEGGGMPLQRRLPKRGFVNIFAKQYSEVRLVDLNRFPNDSVVDQQSLRKAGLAKGRSDGVKVIGNGELRVALKLKVNRISAGAKELIEAAGGSVELIPDQEKWIRKDSRAQRRKAS